MRALLKPLALVSLLAALLAAAWMGSAYQSDISRARTRVATGSRVIGTPCGAIEYAESGDGPAVLLIHGAGGGFDQGLALAASFLPPGYRVIAMSRFGYLRTPAPADASIVLQADAHACLLDALAVGSATVVGVSAGAPSALEFALRHDERCKRLILLVPGWFPSPERVLHRLDPLTQAALAWVLHSDFAFWGISRFLPDTAMRTVLGTPPDVVAAASRAEQARVAAMLRDILPISQRSAGLSLEGRLTVQPLSAPLSSIKAPTLTITAEDDLYGTYGNAQVLTRGVPHARLIAYPLGGHLLVGHGDEVKRAIADFLVNAKPE